MSIIKLEDVSYTYSHPAGPVSVLSNINLEINQGEFIVISGPSGSGKTTLLNLLGLIDTPIHGQIQFMGQDVTSLPERKRTEVRAQHIGFVFQFFYLQPFLSLRENVELPLNFVQTANHSIVDEVIEAVGLADRANHLPNQLSGGQIQRAAIARALVTKPNIILADEPTGNLDSEAGKRIIDLLHTTNKQFNTTIIVVTHDDSIAETATLHIDLKDGKLHEK